MRLTAALLAGAPTVADVARISLGSGEFLFVRIAADTAAVLHELALKTPLLFPHSAPQPILVRESSLMCSRWIQVCGATDCASRLGASRHRSFACASAPTRAGFRILSTSGSTRRPESSPARFSVSPMRPERPSTHRSKVDAIDRQNGYLLTRIRRCRERPLWARRSRRWNLPSVSTCSANRTRAADQEHADPRQRDLSPSVAGSAAQPVRAPRDRDDLDRGAAWSG